MAKQKFEFISIKEEKNELETAFLHGRLTREEYIARLRLID